MSEKQLNDVKIKVKFNAASTRANLVSEDNLATIAGKLSKWYTDFNSVVWNGTATALATNAGSATQPVYFSGGKPTACTYTLGKSVPSDAVFTDHTYSNMTAATASAAGKAGLVPAPGAGKNTSFLRGDGTWVVPTNTDTKVTTSTKNDTSETSYYPTWTTGTTTAGLYINDGLTVSTFQGTTSAAGFNILKVGNATAAGTAGNKYGVVRLYSESTGHGSVKQAATTSNVVHNLPATGGTILNTGTTSVTQTLTSGTKVGEIKINGTSTILYAPTNTNTTYTFAEGSTNGAFSVTPSGGSATSVKIHGLGSAAYTDYSAYAAATHTHSEYYSSAVNRKPNYVLAGPASGTTEAGATFRALVAADIPSIPKSKISDFPTIPTVPSSLKNPYALTVKGGTTTAFTYDGSAAKTLTVKAGTGISIVGDTSGNITVSNTSTNTDTKVSTSFIEFSAGNAAYFPTFSPTNQTDGLYMMKSFIFQHQVGTADTSGHTYLVLGNGVPIGADDNEEGFLKLFSEKNGAATLKSAALDDDTEHILPATSGTLLNTGTTSFAQTLTSGTKIGSIRINGSSTDIYAPTNTNTTYTLKGAYGSSSNTWVTTLTPSSGTATTSTVPTATTSAYGITKLSSATNSTSTALAATASAVKSAYDLAAGKSVVSVSQTLTSGTKIGSITVNGTATDLYCQTNTNTDTKVSQSETTTVNYRPLILGATSNTDATKLNTSTTDATYVASGLYAQPSTGSLFANNVNVADTIVNTGRIIPYTTDGAAGYYCVMQIKVDATYMDCPIEFAISNRGSIALTRVTVRFTNTDSTDPTLTAIRYRGYALDVYACKSTTSTWQIWVKAADTYSRLTVHDVYCTMMDKITISYPNSYMTTANFTTAIASGGSLATNTKATIGTEYYVGSATGWTTSRNINGMSVDGRANRVNYGTCSTAAGTAAKTVACTGFALITGAEITVKFTTTNTAANPTLNVNSTGAKAIYYRGAAITAGYLASGRTYTFRYNGTQYEAVGDMSESVKQNKLEVSTSSNYGIKLPLLLSAKSASQNTYTDSNNLAINCSSIVGQSSMTNLAWLETNYYTTSGTAGRSYATICAEMFRTVGDGYFQGDALSARALSKKPKINGVEFDGATNTSILTRLYSGAGAATVTLASSATDYDLLIITVSGSAGKNTIFHRTSEQYIRHPYCNSPNPSQNGLTTTVVGSMMTTVSGTSLKVEVSNIIITGSGSSVTATSATRTATITEVYGLKFS